MAGVGRVVVGGKGRQLYLNNNEINKIKIRNKNKNFPLKKRNLGRSSAMKQLKFKFLKFYHLRETF